MLLFDVLGKWFSLLWTSLSPFLSPMITSFLSVLIGALPFMVIAAFASAVLEVFVPRDVIARLMPKNGLWGVLLAPVLGLVIPMCECGIVPVARRMVQKGVPPAAAVTFMLANPILNPLVFYATYLAFPNFHTIVWLRMGFGYLVAVGTGLLLHQRLRGNPGEAVLNERHLVAVTADDSAAVHVHDHEHGHGHDHDHSHEHHAHGPGLGEQVQAMLEHAAHEFFDVTKYFIIGSALAAIAQTAISRSTLEALGKGPVISVLVMITFAYLLCICSEADAFVAATFASTFTPGALLGFLVAGPMTDIKNTLMMLSAFNRRTVLFLNAAIIGLTAVLTIGANIILFRGG